jgi:hypothetical protein
VRIAVAIWTDRRQNQFGEKSQTRRERVQEAEKIYEWLTFQSELAGDLIRNCMQTIIVGSPESNGNISFVGVPYIIVFRILTPVDSVARRQF